MAGSELTEIVDQVAGPAPEQVDETPSYELIGTGSIPVSRKAGRRWKEAIDDAIESYKSDHTKWDAALTAYRQTGDEGAALEDGSNAANTYKWHLEGDTDENLTRENVKVLLRNSYTQNPDIEFSTSDKEDEPMARVLKLTINQLLTRRFAPGINAKARLRRAIVHGHLTNFGIVKLGFQEKAGSRQEALAILNETREQLSKAKDQNTLDQLYAKLEEMEQELPLRNNGGFTLENVLPHRLLVDPECNYLDLSDAGWTAEEIWLDTAFIRQRYMEEQEDGTFVRKSDGKHTKAIREPRDADQDSTAVSDRVTEVVIGYTNDERRKALQKGITRCYLIWDRMTQTVLLFTEDDWDYPLWVFEDSLKISRFFPYFIVGYTEPIDGIVQAGESSQYAGHVREINKINRRTSYIRNLAYSLLIFNSRKIKGESATALLNAMQNPTRVRSVGIDVDPEVKLEDVFELFVPPDAKVKELFDKSDLMRVIDRTNSISPIQRGDQLRTNTTNDAVAAYASAAESVTNEQRDAIEDVIEALCLSLAELIVSKFTKEDVAAIIGNTEAEPFTPMSVEEFNTSFSLRVAAGTTEKPSSANKKKEAMGIAQALGQVGQQAPMTTIRIIARMFSTAFSSFLWGKEDEEMLTQEGMAALQKGISTPGGAQQPQQPPQPPPEG